MKDLIQLQNANMFQETKTATGDKTDWLVRENLTDEVLATFPSKTSDQDMFAIIHFAREFELKAFNAGIDFAKQQKLKGFDLESPYKTPDLKLIKEA
jgi:hypothetical protein